MLRESKMKKANMPEVWVLTKVTLPVQLSHLLLNSLREERAHITPKTKIFRLAISYPKLEVASHMDALHMDDDDDRIIDGR